MFALQKCPLNSKQNGDLSPISGQVRFKQRSIRMSNWTGTGINGEDLFGCPPAMGISFASGTSDGPGALEHGMNWDYVNENYDGQDQGFTDQDKYVPELERMSKDLIDWSVDP